MNSSRQQRLENELKYLKARVRYLESLITCQPDLAFLFDEQCRYIDVLTSCESQLYKTPVEMIGRRLSEVLPDKIGEEAECIVERTFATGKSHVYEYRLDVPDGTHWFEGRTALLTTDYGRHVIWATRNITVRKKMEHELIKQKALLTTAIESLPFEFWVCDRERICILQNSKAVSALGDLTGKRISDFPWKKKRIDFINGHLDSVMTGSPVQLETTRTTDETENDYLIIGSPIIIDGQIEGATCINIDITTQKKNEAELSRMQRIESLGVLAGGIAHDFNNLLMSIMGNISMAQICGEERAVRDDYLDSSMKQIEQAKKLTSQLLTFARGGAPKRRTVLLQDYLPSWVKFALSGSSADISLSIQDNLYPVSIDTDQFSQIINNLVINSAQTGQPGLSINVTAENADAAATGGKWIELTISDNGPGIPENIRGRIFDPYFTTREGGTGLGLTICHSIVTQHGGRISVKPAIPRGSVFTIALPASGELPVFADTDIRPGIEPGSGRILVLDDDVAIGKILEKFLSRAGYGVHVATCSRDAVNEYRASVMAGNPFSAILLDLTIPGDCGGIECLRMMKKINPDVKAVVMSGYADNTALADYREHGFSGSLEKPFSLESLSTLLSSIILKY